MDDYYRLRTHFQRRWLAVAMAILWSMAAVVPGLHLHDSDELAEAHCQDSGLTASPHLEPHEPAHPEPCGLCAKLLSCDGLAHPQALLADVQSSEPARDKSGDKPPTPPSRYGSSRAPPLA